jgi:ketosteroid isomerase-like protein
VFALDSAEPIAGQKAFKSYYGPTLIKIKRKVKLVSEDAQASGDQVIVSQLLQISGKGVSTNVRQTVVWGKFDGKWKMAHIHNARVGEPIGLGKTPTTATGIRVLNERIATAAAVVGVAQ